MIRSYGSSVTVQKPKKDPNHNYSKTKEQPHKNGSTKEQEDYIKKNFDFDYSKYYFGSPFRWRNFVVLTLLHILSIHGLYNYEFFKSRDHIFVAVWGYIVGVSAGIGVTAGAHRLWCHRAYKAKLSLRIFLMILFCMAGQNSLCDWVRDHRVHHKYSETDADPHNSKRGFFFSHIGWLMIKKHPEVIRRGLQTDISDLMEDPVVAFQQKYFLPLKIFWSFIFPCLLPLYACKVHWYWIIGSQVLVRYTLSLHATFLVNSAAHMWGDRPYDKRIRPVENLTVAFWSAGEGWHNYHHAFPWDYRASEMGKYNPTTLFLNICSYFGLAYDMKSPSPKLVKQIAEKYGDESWGDKEISESEATSFKKR